MGELAALFHDLHAPPPAPSEIEWLVAQLPHDAGALLVASADAGRLLLALAEHGLHAHGIDASPARLALCERRLRSAGRSPPLFRQDIEGLNLPFRYAGAVIGAPVAQAVDRTRMPEALQRLWAHLIAPGVLIMELVIPEYAQHPPGASIVDIERVKLDDGSVITRRSELQVNAEARRLDIAERYEKRSGAAVAAREDACVSITWYTPEEMVQLVHDSGFRAARTEDLPSGAEPDGIPRFAVIASR